MVVLQRVVILVCSWEEVSSGSFHSIILATLCTYYWKVFSLETCLSGLAAIFFQHIVFWFLFCSSQSNSLQLFSSPSLAAFKISPLPLFGVSQFHSDLSRSIFPFLFIELEIYWRWAYGWVSIGSTKFSAINSSNIVSLPSSLPFLLELWLKHMLHFLTLSFMSLNLSLIISIILSLCCIFLNFSWSIFWFTNILFSCI